MPVWVIANTGTRKLEYMRCQHPLSPSLTCGLLYYTAENVRFCFGLVIFKRNVDISFSLESFTAGLANTIINVNKTAPE